MEQDEVTAANLKTILDEKVHEFEHLVQFISAHYNSQIDRTVQFQKELDDRCITAGIANFDDQKDIIVKILEVEFNVWQHTLEQCMIKLAIGLQYLRTRCVEPIAAEDDPYNSFIARAIPIESEAVNKKEIAETIKESTRYRNVERIQIQDLSEANWAAVMDWNKEVARKLKEGNESVLINAADQEWIADMEQYLEGWSDAVKIMENCEGESVSFIERITDIFGKAALAFKVQCTDLIDLSVETVTHDSEKIIEEVKELRNALYNSLESCTNVFLEKRRVRHCIAHGLADFSVGPKCMTQLAEEMEAKLNSLRSELEAILAEVSTYRIDERKTVDNAFRKLKGDNADENSDLKMAKLFPEIELTSYPRVVLARGGEGTVYRCEIPGALVNSTEETVSVACKQFEKDSIDSHAVYKILAISSQHLLESHEGINYVMRSTGHGIMDNCRFLLMELCPRSLADVIETCRKEGKYLNKDDLTKWGEELTSGMNFLHDTGIYHGDLKPNNILINAANEVKIADFGLSIQADSNMIKAKFSFKRGTQRYMAPEQHRDRQMTLVDVRRCDVWSYGICLWEMMTCRTPFGDLPDAALPLRIGTNCEISHPPLPMQPTCETLEILLRNCWNSILEQRWPFYFILGQFADVKEEISDFCDHAWIEECSNWASSKYESPKVNSSTITHINRRRSF